MHSVSTQRMVPAANAGRMGFVDLEMWVKLKNLRVFGTEADFEFYLGTCQHEVEWQELAPLCDDN